jgi:uncharacterized phage infection (PIP) family protein YhgE
MIETALGRVVELNEGAKEIRWHSYELSLRALGATAQSLRAGGNLRGFVEVSSQMQSWCRQLAKAVGEVTALSTRQVRLVSDITRRSRLHGFLERAGKGPKPSAELHAASERLNQELVTARKDLKRLRDTLTDGIDGLRLLGLMASALSRAALIEASSAGAEQRGELTLISKEFAERAEQVSDTVRRILTHSRGVEP